MRAITVLLLVAIAVGCSGSADTDTTDAAPQSTTVAAEVPAPETTTTTVQETTTTTQTVDGTDPPQPPPTTQASTTTSTTTTTTTVPATTTTSGGLPPFPPARQNLEHGGETWAVILAAAEDFSDPVLGVAVESAAAAGYTTGVTDCDLGVAEAIGLPSNASVASVSVYFETEQDAQAALLAFEVREIPGIVATVFTYCLD